MTSTPDPNDQATDEARRKLERLGVQTEAMQALLVRLLQDIVRAENRLEAADAERLVKVNEQLVVSALLSKAEAKEAAEALAAGAATVDPLTRLPNRAALFDRFVQASANAKRHGTQCALLFVDLDNFKQFNDAKGHGFGDKVLQLVAARMLSVVREVDSVCRHGGDEFVIVLAELGEPADAEKVAAKVTSAIAEAAEVDGQPVQVTASVGIAIYPDDGADVDTLVARADVAMYESKRQRPGGIAFHDPGSGAPPRGPEAAPSSRRAAEATEAESAMLLTRLREANEKLVLAAVTARELQEAAELAQRRQAEFIAKVTAELLDPKAPIRIVSAMLGKQPSDEPLRPLLPLVKDIVERQTMQVGRLVRNLPDASKGERGALELALVPIDLRAVIEGAVATHRTLLQERKQRLDVQVPDAPFRLRGDAAYLQQAILNLLENASSHTLAGGRIRLTAAMAEGVISLTVSDNGLGITPQTLPHVFEPFVKDAHALSASGLGPGIGLTVARALVRAHGGDLRASSAGVNRGSAFVMTLPADSSKEGGESRGPPAGEGR